MTSSIAPCPFCGWGHVKTTTKRTNHGPGGSKAARPSQVLCSRCKARGPLRPTEDDAVDGWNAVRVHSTYDTRTDP